MMRLLPQSLFGRMILILLGGLIFAQGLSAAISLYERRNLVFKIGRIESAQRIADIVRLLESIDPTQRPNAAAVLSVPPFRVSLDLPPAVAAEPSLGDEDQHAAFSARLRASLGEDRTFRITAIRPPVTMQHNRIPDIVHELGRKVRPPGPADAEASGSTPPWSPAVVQVRLNDGTWVTFNPLVRVREFRFFWSSRLFVNLAILFVAVILLLLVAVRWVTRPLHVLSVAAEALGKNINSPPLAEKGPLEVRRAARAFNLMQTRLVRYLQDRTRWLAAMSHDLKTPITRLRLRTELLDDAELKARFAKDLEDMEAMVTETLDFIRGVDKRGPVHPVDVMALLESLQADSEEIGRQVEIEGAVQRPYPADPQALKRCIANLVDNAIKYGKRARISVSDDERTLRIVVSDEGPGIPEAELERVLEPFYRLEGSRSRDTGGTGLGLTIARNIAEMHGGTLTLRNAASGGLEATLSLPR